MPGPARLNSLTFYLMNVFDFPVPLGGLVDQPDFFEPGEKAEFSPDVAVNRADAVMSAALAYFLRPFSRYGESVSSPASRAVRPLSSVISLL